MGAIDCGSREGEWMGNEIIHTVADLVEVSYRANLKAVNLKWSSEYDEGDRVEAMLTGDLIEIHTIFGT
jgi:hypothetical protein